jgi:hypothetical protein
VEELLRLMGMDDIATVMDLLLSEKWVPICFSKSGCWVSADV